MAMTMSDDPIDDVSDDPDTGQTGRDATSPAGLDQFQQAALDAIRAGRAMLDAAESMIRDPSAADAVARSVAGLARTATQTVAGFAAGWPGSKATDPDGDGDVGSESDGSPDEGYEPITVD